jgi:hypothetical protein
MRFKSPGGYLCETRIFLLAFFRYSTFFSRSYLHYFLSCLYNSLPCYLHACCLLVTFPPHKLLYVLLTLRPSSLYSPSPLLLAFCKSSVKIVHVRMGIFVRISVNVSGWLSVIVSDCVRIHVQVCSGSGRLRKACKNFYLKLNVNMSVCSC